ncbi:MAG: hypothetical protein JST16_03180 [Bdellovibrionales bacterium]|nr:hypothetical protein [Bdellovibrionales bacterium]
MKKKNRSKRKPLIVAAVLGAGLGFLAWQLGSDLGTGVAVASLLYAVLVTLFLLAQIVGFVVSQVSYSQSVESAKMKVLQVEGIPCDEI